MKTSNHQHGFTLVELLVVISIIALLVALLLPTLASARKAARITLCGSQLRQHGVALNAYQVDSSGYYPLFGGPITDIFGDGSQWGSITETGAFGLGTYEFSTKIYNIFGTYLNLPSGGAVTPMNSTAPIKYCPVVDWFHYGPYTFRHPGATIYTSGEPGYSYYTGRAYYAAAGDPNTFFNTINRREDPREILMTDLLMEVDDPSQNGTFSVGSETTSVDYFLARWFNPHVDRSSIPTATGSGHHLAADGHVAALGFRASRVSDPNYDPTSHILLRHYSDSLFTGAITGPAGSITDGRYAITP